jgi:hypothetical protein
MPASNSKKLDGGVASGVAKGPRPTVSWLPGEHAAASQRGGRVLAMLAAPDRPDTWLARTVPPGLRRHPEEGSVTNSPRRNSLTYNDRHCYLLTPE